MFNTLAKYASIYRWLVYFSFSSFSSSMKSDNHKWTLATHSYAHGHIGCTAEVIDEILGRRKNICQSLNMVNGQWTDYSKMGNGTGM